MKKVLVVRPGIDVKEDIFLQEFDEEKFLEEMYKIIDCNIIDIPVMGDGWLMVADDEGLIKDNTKINPYFLPKAFELIGNKFAGTLVFVGIKLDENGEEEYEDISPESLYEILKHSNIWDIDVLQNQLLNNKEEK